MTPEQINIHVGAQESTDDLLNRLANVPPGTGLRLYMAGGTPALRALGDMDRLRDLMAQHRWPVTIVAADPAVLLRARVYGLPAVAPPAELPPPDPGPWAGPSDALEVEASSEAPDVPEAPAEEVGAPAPVAEAEALTASVAADEAETLPSVAPATSLTEPPDVPDSPVPAALVDEPEAPSASVSVPRVSVPPVPSDEGVMPAVPIAASEAEAAGVSIPVAEPEVSTPPPAPASRIEAPVALVSAAPAGMTSRPVAAANAVAVSRPAVAALAAEELAAPGLVTVAPAAAERPTNRLLGRRRLAAILGGLLVTAVLLLALVAWNQRAGGSPPALTIAPSPTLPALGIVPGTPATATQVAAAPATTQPTASPAAAPSAVAARPTSTLAPTTAAAPPPTTAPVHTPTQNATAGVAQTNPTPRPPSPTAALTIAALPTTRQASSTPDPALALAQRVAQAEDALRSGELQATIDYGGGTRSSTLLRFDLGGAGRPPAIEAHAVYSAPTATQTSDFVMIADRAWQRTANGAWTVVAQPAQAWEQLQNFLPHAAQATAPTLESKPDGAELGWYNSGRDVDVVVRADPATGIPREVRQTTRATGAVLTIIYAGWNTPVEIVAPAVP